MNFDDNETKDGDILIINCENNLNDNSQGREFIAPPPAPPIPLALLNQVEHVFPFWDSDDDCGRIPVTVKRLFLKLLFQLYHPSSSVSSGLHFLRVFP